MRTITAHLCTLNGLKQTPLRYAEQQSYLLCMASLGVKKIFNRKLRIDAIFLPQNAPETVAPALLRKLTNCGPGPAEEAYNALSYSLTGFKG